MIKRVSETQRLAAINDAIINLDANLVLVFAEQRRQLGCIIVGAAI